MDRRYIGRNEATIREWCRLAQARLILSGYTREVRRTVVTHASPIRTITPQEHLLNLMLRHHPYAHGMMALRAVGHYLNSI